MYTELMKLHLERKFKRKKQRQSSKFVLIVHINNLSVWDIERKGSGVQGHVHLHPQ